MPQKPFSGNLVSHLPEVFKYIGYEPAGNQPEMKRKVINYIFELGLTELFKEAEDVQ